LFFDIDVMHNVTYMRRRDALAYTDSLDLFLPFFIAYSALYYVTPRIRPWNKPTEWHII